MFLIHVTLIVLFFVRFSLMQLLSAIVVLNICIGCLFSKHGFFVMLGVMGLALASTALFVWALAFDPTVEIKNESGS
jgi:hypothetical protein